MVQGLGFRVLSMADVAAEDMCLVVTHGLTIRLMLMCLFNWSVATFESVWSLAQPCIPKVVPLKVPLMIFVLVPQAPLLPINPLNPKPYKPGG